MIRGYALTLDGLAHAGGAIPAQRVHERTAKPHCSCSESQRFDDVRASSYSAVKVHFKLLEELRCERPNLQECPQ